MWSEMQHGALTSATYRRAAVLDAGWGKQRVSAVVGPALRASKLLPVALCKVGVSLVSHVGCNTKHNSIQWKSGARVKVTYTRKTSFKKSAVDIHN
jgi:hypothetical protein